MRGGRAAAQTARGVTLLTVTYASSRSQPRLGAWMWGQSLGVLQDGARGSRQDGARVLDVGRCDAGREQELCRSATFVCGLIWLDLSSERGSRAERSGQVLSLSKNEGLAGFEPDDPKSNRIWVWGPSVGLSGHSVPFLVPRFPSKSGLIHKHIVKYILS
jgi:hypothetical protein